MTFGETGPAFVALLSLLALIIAACGGGTTDTTTAGGRRRPPPAVQPEGPAASWFFRVVHGRACHPLVGQIRGADNPDVAISVEGPGTGDGFARFLQPETDISDARGHRRDEVALCEEVEGRVRRVANGLDGLSVITSPNNTEVTCLDFNDLRRWWGRSPEGFLQLVGRQRPWRPNWEPDTLPTQRPHW